METQETIGKEQAFALAKAELKLIVNDDSVNGGINRIGEIFSAKGGTQLGAMLEGLKQTPMGQIAIGELRLLKGKRFKSKHLLLNKLKRLLIAFKVRSGLESN